MQYLNLFILIDILVKNGSSFDLVEVSPNLSVEGDCLFPIYRSKKKIPHCKGLCRNWDLHPILAQIRKKRLYSKGAFPENGLNSISYLYVRMQ